MENPGFRVISGPYKTALETYLIIHSSISLEEAKQGKWVIRADGRPNRQYIVKERFYKTLKRALAEKEKAVKKHMNNFYSANMNLN